MTTPLPSMKANAGETFAILEGVCHQWLLRLEAALRHLVRLQRMWVLHFLPSCLLPHFPLQVGDAAGRATASHEANRRVADLDLIGNIQDLDLCSELFGLAQRCVLLVHHNITWAWHVALVQALNV